MSACLKCNHELAEGAKFCDNCGNKVYDAVYCASCGKQTSTEYSFCQSCGAALSGAAYNGAPEQQAIRKPIPKKLIAVGGIIAGIIIAVAALLIVTAIKPSGGKDVLYLKDNEISYVSLKNIKPFEITDNLYDADTLDEYGASSLGYVIEISEDGKRIIYPDKIDEGDEGFNLYCRSLQSPDKEALKIDSGVQKYAVNNKANRIIYIKGEDGILYQSDLENKEKLDSEVVSFYINEDASKILYVDMDGNIYLKSGNKDKEKIAGEASIQHVSEDLSVLYYLKDGSLYKQEEGKEKVKIDSDVDSVVKIYNSGEFYYCQTEDSTVKTSNYVDDDMKAADMSMVRPESPEYPDWWDYDTTEDYNAALEDYNRAYDAYTAADDAYNAKLIRDELREDLENLTIDISQTSLYYYNGTESVKITDAYVMYSSSYASETAVMTYRSFNQSGIEKLKLSEIDSAYEIEDMVDAALFSSAEQYVAVGGNASIIDQTSAINFRVSASGAAVYFMDDVNDRKVGDLYVIAIDKGAVSDPELYDEDVYASVMYSVRDADVLYFKDVKDDKGDLYLSKTGIDYDVRVWGISVREASLVYFTDWNSDKEYGTLNIFTKDNSSKIADDAHSYYLMENGTVLYLYDYSSTRSKGELYLYTGGKTNKKIDDDVVAIIPINDARVKQIS